MTPEQMLDLTEAEWKAHYGEPSLTVEQILAHLGELEITMMVTDDDHLLFWPASRLPQWLFMETMLAKFELKRAARIRGVRVEPGDGVER